MDYIHFIPPLRGPGEEEPSQQAEYRGGFGQHLHIEHGLANNGPWAKYSQLPDLVNKVFLVIARPIFFCIAYSCFHTKMRVETNEMKAAKPDLSIYYPAWPLI